MTLPLPMAVGLPAARAWARQDRRILHTAARIIRGQRKRKIRIPETWPWAHDLAAALDFGLALDPGG